MFSAFFLAQTTLRKFVFFHIGRNAFGQRRGARYKTMAAQSESTLELLQSVHSDLRKEAALSGASTRVMLEKLELCFARLRSPDALVQEAEELRIRVRRRSLIGSATPRGGSAAPTLVETVVDASSLAPSRDARGTTLMAEGSRV